MTATLLTVLRSGGDYLPEHVEALRDQAARHAPGLAFRCLSDVDVPGRIPMRTDWPGWWAKIEALGVPGPALYLDLDSVIRAPLDRMLAAMDRHSWITLRDLDPRAPRTVASGVMAWSGDMSALRDRFAEDPARHMSENVSPRWWGDGGFVERHAPRPAFWQDVAPGAIVSWKLDCRAGIPPDACVVAFHGRPRPWEVEIAA